MYCHNGGSCLGALGHQALLRLYLDFGAQGKGFSEDLEAGLGFRV